MTKEEEIEKAFRRQHSEREGEVKVQLFRESMSLNLCDWFKIQSEEYLAEKAKINGDFLKSVYTLKAILDYKKNM